VTGKRTIPVRIHGQEYRVRSEALDDEGVVRAAAMVDETMGRLRERTRTAGSHDVAVLAALNIANHLVALRDERGRAPERPAAADPGRLRALTDLVEQALRGYAAP
jgi:cell division protein ZapA (FtsZ GTPase activity inhibitor)